MGSEGMSRDPIAEIMASRTTGQPPIGATMYCPSFGKGCRWRHEVKNGLVACEAQDAHLVRCRFRIETENERKER